MKMPEPPKVPEEPIQIECLKAKYDAKVLAKAVMDMKREEPLEGKLVMENLARCELIGESAFYATV